MRPPTSIARQILYAAAMTTGIALMGMLAGCALPESTLSAPGFPHASRRAMPIPEPEPATELVAASSSNTRLPVKKLATEVLLEAMWIQPKAVEP